MELQVQSMIDAKRAVSAAPLKNIPISITPMTGGFSLFCALDSPNFCRGMAAPTRLRWRGGNRRLCGNQPQTVSKAADCPPLPFWNAAQIQNAPARHASYLTAKKGRPKPSAAKSSPPQ